MAAAGEVRTGIDRALVAHLARLARLALTDDELDHYVPQIEAVMAMVGTVRDIPDDVPPTARPTEQVNVTRPDVLLPCLTRDQALGAAPAVEDGWFRVPPSPSP
ncbi:Asp-tRNA(Asn)/Glu-tRNA(Gln) amidotransferase subunit GatC [Actinomycetospora straminea]|uniref:Aspartyl/glutamyl-tRNA(Asn/Gln) amidotransferase subunit C n=1 Tax=Actinomycetospora straminea TaxID=663607 RepID=A0ABP9EGR7_9PSEU|nr:Asp-tRNA(Asn)/Glu-tRNA(Gln) amidotransferase subunit GatC [Actinomycetospora straminea]MDD7935688.1 Asp-tRNA(Asn)/Glu-tRNA(Gln) amidotransferase subunit GatC [Actinomycetospora straminea]